MRERLPERRHPHRGKPGAQSRRHRRAGVSGRAPVIRSLPRIGLGILEGRGEPAMDRPALTRKEGVVERLANERMAERVGLALRHDDDHMAGHRRAQCLRHPACRKVADAADQRLVDGAPGDRDDTRDLDGGPRQLVDAEQQRVVECLRRAAAVLRAARVEQLLGEEGVAARAPVDLLERVRVGEPAEDVLELALELGARQRLQPEPRHALAAQQVGEQGTQRMAGLELVGAIGHDQREPGAAEVAHDERQEVARRGVRPVRVLHDQQDRALVAEVFERAAQTLVETPLRGLARLQRRGAAYGELRYERGELGTPRRWNRFQCVSLGTTCQLAQCRYQRRVRELAVADRDAFAPQHEGPAVARLALDLAQQAGLANAGFSANQRE
jgi:hypothetical protein